MKDLMEGKMSVNPRKGNKKHDDCKERSCKSVDAVEEEEEEEETDGQEVRRWLRYRRYEKV